MPRNPSANTLFFSSGGDDYELLICIRAGEETAFETKAQAAGIAVTYCGKLMPISENTTGPLFIIGADGNPLTLNRTGYDHFIG